MPRQIPQTYSEALMLAARQAEQIEQQKPKVLFASAVETSKESVSVGELAKIICQNGVKIGEKRLFQWLREHNYLSRRNDSHNQPVQRSIEQGLFEINRTTTKKPNGVQFITNTTKVTGKGQIYFVGKFFSG
jgi:anti-repressor protein